MGILEFFGYTQLEPRKIKFLTPVLKLESITLFCIDRFSKINSAPFSLLALIPPAFAAAKITASGFILFR